MDTQEIIIEEVTESVEMNNDLFVNRENVKKEKKGFPTELLRGLGVLVIIIASAIYLMQGADALDPYHRHFIFLGITGLFGVLTWIVGGVLKEVKGARTFIALAVATVPVLFTQLGAMVHAMIEKNPESMPESLIFNAVNAGTLTGIIGATAAITIPIILLGNRILARNQMKPLSLLLLASNALLLFPMRATLPVGIVLTIATTGLLFYMVNWFKKDSSVRNKEGGIAATVLFIPLIIMAIRSVTYYIEGTVFAGLLWILGGASAVVLSMSQKKSPAGAVIQTIGSIAVVAGWVFAFSGAELNENLLSYYAVIVPAVLILFGLSFTMNETMSRVIRAISVVALAGTMVLGQFLFFGVGPVVTTLIAGTALIAIATALKDKTALYTGSAAVVVGVFGLLGLLTMALSGNAWLLLMLGGIVIIMGGSLTELFKREWKGHASNLKKEISAWH